MEFVTGGLFVLCLCLIYDKFIPSKSNKTEVKQIDKAEEEQQKRYIEHFDALFNYTPDKAYKKVGR